MKSILLIRWKERHPPHGERHRFNRWLRPVGADGKRHSKAFLLAQKYVSPEHLENLEGLIDDLGLEFLGVEKIEEPEEDQQNAAPP